VYARVLYEEFVCFHGYRNGGDTMETVPLPPRPVNRFTYIPGMVLIRAKSIYIYIITRNNVRTTAFVCDLWNLLYTLYTRCYTRRCCSGGRVNIAVGELFTVTVAAVYWNILRLNPSSFYGDTLLRRKKNKQKIPPIRVRRHCRVRLF